MSGRFGVRLTLSVVAACAWVAALAGQTPDFSGTWKLDSAQSRVTPAAVFAGLIPAGAPDRLHVTQPTNGTLVIESEINEGHARMYRPGGKTTTPAGQGGTIAMTTKWDGPRLVSEGTLAAVSGSTATVREVMSIAPDGRTLRIDITNTAGTETTTSSLSYTKTTTLDPCEKWSTPCKRP